VRQPSICLDSERLHLRELSTADVTNEYVSGLNDPEVNRYLVEVRRATQTLDSVRAYVAHSLQTPNSWLFGIALKGTDKLIGTVRLHEVNTYHLTATIGICLFDKTSWGKGYGSEAVSRVVKYAFSELGLRYLEAACYRRNTGSQKLFLKAGFNESARYLRKYRLDKQAEEVIFLEIVNPGFQGFPEVQTS